MTAATITPLRSGGAVFELNSMAHWFPDWRAAVAEAAAHGIGWEWASIDAHTVEVAALAPSVRVLT